MSAATDQPGEKAVSGLLLGAVVLAAIVLLREGPYYDNVAHGWRFFTLAFFTGAIIGFTGWTIRSGVTPALSLKGRSRQPWLAAMVAALVVVSAASYINRGFAGPAYRHLVLAVDTITEGKAGRLYVGVKTPQGNYERYLIPTEAIERIRQAKNVRLSYARGALGYDFISGIEPAP